MQRIDGFIVNKKTDQNKKKTTFAIYVCSKSRKKAVLTVVLYNKTGTIVIQGQAYLDWKECETELLLQIREGKRNTHDEIEVFAKLLDPSNETTVSTNGSEGCKSKGSIPVKASDDQSPSENNNTNLLIERLEQIECDNVVLKSAISELKDKDKERDNHMKTLRGMESA